MTTQVTAVRAAKVASRFKKWLNDTGQRGLGKRTQIVSPVLCRDVLDQLGPSLEQFKGCDLIDVRPGVGLWSEHLHEFLKPRRHILVEPAKDFYSQYLDRVLAKYPQSMQWTNKTLYSVIHEHDLLGKFKQYAWDKPPTEINNRILLTINLSAPLTEDARIQVGRREQYFSNNLWASLFGMRDDLYARGLIRVLAWTPDEHKHQMLPRAVNDRARQTLELELCSQITEVAGGSAIGTTARHRRMYNLELEDMASPQDVHSNYGLSDQHEVLEARTDLPPLPSASELTPTVQTFVETEHINPPVWLDRLIELDAQVKTIDPKLYNDLEPYWKDPSGPPRQISHTDPIVKEWLLLYRKTRHHHVIHKRIHKVVHEQRALEEEWRATPSDSDPRVPALKQRAATILENLSQLRDVDQTRARLLIDDFRIRDTNATQWYRRPFNPLIVHPREFATYGDVPSNLALMDIQISPTFRLKFDTEVKAMCLNYVLINTISVSASANVYSVIASLLNNAGTDDFLEGLPQLKDVRRGGWYDLHELRLRTLPTDLWAEIALAYVDWPFRRSQEGMNMLIQEQMLGNKKKRPV